MDKLKPCPFCGGKAVMISEPITHDRFLVACKNRGDMCKCEPCTNWFATREEAAETWNRRANDASVRHGCWIGEGDGYADGKLVYDVWNCSECDYCIDDGTDDPERLPKYCPGCGALMDGGKDNG